MDDAKKTQEVRTNIYSPMNLKHYDVERHITIDQAYELLETQNDANLYPEKLKQAINQREVRVSSFKGKDYVDRLDIGRIYHETQKERRGLSIGRYFSKKGEDPLDSVKWRVRDAIIPDYKNEGNIFEMSNAEFPASWNDNQVGIVAQKYFFKPDKADWKSTLNERLGRGHEYSLKHLINRITNFMADEGYKLGYFATVEDKNVFADELKWLQVNRRLAFNSPVQFNAGIFNEYGVAGSQGIGFWKDYQTGKIERVDGEYVHPQSHACFIKGPRDNLEDILQHVLDEGIVFSLGSGIGQDIGALRSEGELLSGGGKASGPMSFLKILDDGAGTIKSGGKSRRAARMSTMRYHHADIMKFIPSKVEEDKKALILMQNGYEGGMDGEAVRTVTLQNTNISVRLDDYFFEQLKNGGDVELIYTKSGEIAEKVSAERMLKEISFGSWRVGDPAVQYESKIQEMHTGKNSGRQNSTNPCSEYLYLDDTACDLNSHNLAEYADSRGNFDTKGFSRGVWLSSIAADILNDASSYPIKDIAIISPEFRTIGVGYAGLGKLLMRKGIPYDSEDGRALAGAITALMTGSCYEASIDMAENIGTFTHFEFNRKPMEEVMEKHRKNLEDIAWEHVPEDLKKDSYNSWENVVRKGKKLGFRNAQATVLAPTGTISYLLGSEDSTGVEPALSLLVQKNLAGGGSLFIANDEVPNALLNLGYDENQISDIVNFINEQENGIVRSSVIGAPHLSPDYYGVFDTSFGNSNGEGSIEFEGHIRMLGATQPFISGAISKTNNLPTNANVKEIYEGFLLGHELGLKAVAVFRNNSKPTQAVGFGDKNLKVFRRGEKEDLPYSGDSFRQAINIGETPFLINIGEYKDGRPGEIVINSYTSDSTLGAVLKIAGIDASTSLKGGVDLEDVVKKWVHGFEPRGFVTVEDSSGKIISHPYIKQANSPLDFIRKLTLLHYKGQKEFATEPDKVNLGDLRGAKNGAFRAYRKMEIDEWDVDQVLKDPELGGFEEFKNGEDLGSLLKNNSNSNKNTRGVTCLKCGNIMMQTAPGCFSCGNCGEGIGGCGM